MISLVKWIRIWIDCDKLIRNRDIYLIGELSPEVFSKFSASIISEFDVTSIPSTMQCSSLSTNRNGSSSIGTILFSLARNSFELTFSPSRNPTFISGSRNASSSSITNLWWIFICSLYASAVNRLHWMQFQLRRLPQSVSVCSLWKWYLAIKDYGEKIEYSIE